LLRLLHRKFVSHPKTQSFRNPSVGGRTITTGRKILHLACGPAHLFQSSGCLRQFRDETSKGRESAARRVLYFTQSIYKSQQDKLRPKKCNYSVFGRDVLCCREETRTGVSKEPAWKKSQRTYVTGGMGKNQGRETEPRRPSQWLAVEKGNSLEREVLRDDRRRQTGSGNCTTDY